MLDRLAGLAPAGLARAVVRWARPGLVNHRLTDAPVVRALRRASGVEAVVAVYDDGAAPHATPATLERELDVTLPAGRALRLPTVSAHSFAPTRRTVRAVSLADAEPPVVLLSRRSLRRWSDRLRSFVLGHEFGHLLVASDGAADPDAAVESLLPAPDRSAAALRALVAAHREYRAGEAHADIRAGLPERHRPPASVMAGYHDAERAGEGSPVASAAERRALAIRNAAKYLPLPYDPPGVGEEVRSALARPLPRYLDWVAERRPEQRPSA